MEIDSSQKTLRVLHTPSRVGGNAWHLSRGERENAIQSDVLYLENSNMYFGILQGDIDPPFNNPHGFIKILNAWCFYRKAVKHYDVFHFNFGRTMVNFPLPLRFFDMVDILYLKLKKKVIAVTFQGSDARQGDYCLEHFNISHYKYMPKEMYESKLNLFKLLRSRIKKFEKYADIIYTTNADLMNVLPERTKFRPYTKLDLREWTPSYSDYTKERTLIVHAPSDRIIKGTAFIEEAIQRLIKDGYPVDFRLIENLPNDEAKRLYQEADIVIDQILIGWYGGFSVECMAMGKPVVCYIRESDMHFLPEGMDEDMPIIRVTPDTIYERLKYYLEHKDELSEIARASRRYVEKWHDRKKIAADIIQDYYAALSKKG